MIPRLFLVAVQFLGSVTAALAGGPHPSLPPPVIPDCLGVNIHFTDPKPGELEMLAAAGFKWVRMDLGWADTEKKPGEHDFSAYDRLVAALDKHKIRAVFILDYGNPLYAEPDDKHPFTSRAHTPEFRDAFARWAVAAVGHFKGRGYLWEMWNEPNLEQFWKAPAGREDYIALAKATGEALRAAKLLGEKGEAFIGPATSTIDQPFLEACFQAGLLEFWDAVSVHPYRQTEPETVEDEYRTVRLLIRTYAPKDRTIPIISSGWGYSTAWKDFDEQKQAKYLPRQLLTNLSNDVALSIWYDWHDDGPDPKDPEHHFGLVAHEYHADRDPVYDPKPAYQAMKTLTEHLDGFLFNKRLAFNPWESRDDRVLLFEKGDEIRVAAWTSGDRAHEIELPASNGELTLVQSDGRKTPGVVKKETGGPLGLRYILGTSAGYLSFQKPNDLLHIAAAVTRLPLEMVFDTPGKSPQFSFGFKNCASKPVSARLSNRDSYEQLLVSADADVQTQQVPPGASFEKMVAAQLKHRGERPTTLTLGIEVGESVPAHHEKNVPIYQMVRLIPSNPLVVTRLPSPPEEVVVKIENPSGQLWKGTVNAFANGYKGRGPIISEKTEVILPENVFAVVTHLPLIKKEGRDNSWTSVTNISLVSSAGLVSDFRIPDARLIPLDVSALEILPDGDSKTEEVPAASAEPPADGAVMANVPTLRLKYSFSADRKFFRVINPTWPPPGEKNLIRSPKTFGLWIYGDGRGCMPRMRFMDSTEQVFQSSGPRIDWKGWRQVFFPMQSTPENPLECWGGDDDGKIHYPIEFDSIFLLENVAREKLDGEIFISAPTLIYGG